MCITLAIPDHEEDSNSGFNGVPVHVEVEGPKPTCFECSISPSTPNDDLTSAVIPPLYQAWRLRP